MYTLKRICKTLGCTFALTVLPLSAHALNRTWACGTDNWSNSACWTPSGLPTSVDNTYINSPARVIAIDSSTGNAFASNLSIHNNATAMQTGGQLKTNELRLGSGDNASLGSFVQKGGVVSTDALFIGFSPGSSGLYNQDAGRLDANNVYLGYNSGTLGRAYIGTIGDNYIGFARWAVENALYVGSSDHSSSGRLKVERGGVVSANNLTVMNADSSIDIAHNSGKIDIAGAIQLYDGAKATSIRNSYIGSGLSGHRGLAGIVAASATISGDGSLWESPTFSVGYGSGGSGVVTVENGGTLKSSRTYSAAGITSIGGITHDSHGTLNINAGGTVHTESDGVVGTRSGEGLVTVGGADALWTVEENLHLGGWIYDHEIYRGKSARMVVNEGGTVNVGGEMAIWDPGSVIVANGANLSAASVSVKNGSLQVDGRVDSSVDIDGGLLIGTGTITQNVNIINGGQLQIGNSPAAFIVGGDYSQDQSTKLVFELDGEAPGSKYHRLNVGGTATLAGKLQLDWYDMGSELFNVSLGDSFDLLSAETISGEFDRFINRPVLGEGLGWGLSYLTDEFDTTDVLRLTVITTPVPAAVWLFGSGLLALVGLSKRRRMAVD